MVFLKRVIRFIPLIPKLYRLFSTAFEVQKDGKLVPEEETGLASAFIDVVREAIKIKGQR